MKGSVSRIFQRVNVESSDIVATAKYKVKCNDRLQKRLREIDKWSFEHLPTAQVGVMDGFASTVLIR